MKQLFANNAKTTLQNSITTASTALVVVDGSKFPSPGSFEFFLCTLELGSSIEILMITNRSGNTLTIGGKVEVGETVPGRGQELTLSQNFAAGARVECRITKLTLARNSTAYSAVASVDLILAPKDSYNDGYVAATYDPFGNPVIPIVKDLYTWRFMNFTTQLTATATAGTTTTITATSLSVTSITSGKYLIQFTSGALTGLIRVVNACAGNVLTWTTVTPSAPQVGDTFEVLKSNASILFDVLAISDDAVIMPLLLGGE